MVHANIVGSMDFVQSWRANFNPDDRGKDNYPLWLEFPTLYVALRSFWICSLNGLVRSCS